MKLLRLTAIGVTWLLATATILFALIVVLV